MSCVIIKMMTVKLLKKELLFNTIKWACLYYCVCVCVNVLFWEMMLFRNCKKRDRRDDDDGPEEVVESFVVVESQVSHHHVFFR